jgi:hypothetical protein
MPREVTQDGATDNRPDEVVWTSRAERMRVTIVQ